MICAGNFLPIGLYDVDPSLSTVSCHSVVYFRILCADAAERFNKRKSNFLDLLALSISFIY